MQYFYLYERKQRRTALLLLLNMGVLLAMVLAARKFLEPGEATDQLFYWMNIALPLVEFGLLVVAFFFWVQNGTLRISVDADRFEIDDPLSNSASFSVPVSEIEEISQTHQKHTNFNTIMMVMESGEKIQISQNYHCSRRKLYAALAKANSDIRLPEHAYRFKQVR